MQNTIKNSVRKGDMMNEVELMYENAGFSKKHCKDYSCIVCDKNKDCDKYPPFTKEKQIELIKWLAGIYELSIYWDKQYNSYRFVIRNYKNGRLNHSVCGYEVPFEETLAYLINRIWQDLTAAEQNEIREILK